MPTLCIIVFLFKGVFCFFVKIKAEGFFLRASARALNLDNRKRGEVRNREQLLELW